MKLMAFLAFLPQYFIWHYSTALVDFARTASNFFWCIWHYFSIEILARSFFVPWKRLNEAQNGFIARVIVGISMRAIGILARLAVFAAASVSFVLLSIVSVFAFVLWLILPLIVVLLFIVGIRSLL
jgi:hypothetical protein